jgi:ribosome-associated GTPase EngA
VVAVNKCESEKVGGAAAADFWQLGLGEPHAVSALHGVGTAEVLESLFGSIRARGTAFPGFGTKAGNLDSAKKNLRHKGPLPWEDETDYKMRKYGIGDPAQRVLDDYDAAVAAFADEARPEEVNVAIMYVLTKWLLSSRAMHHPAQSDCCSHCNFASVFCSLGVCSRVCTVSGRPNVGKSSLINAIFGENRAIVSEVAGTTRDSIDAVMERPPPPGTDEPSTIYRFVDTAGIRRKGKVEYGPEFFMVNRALRAIRRSDVALLVLDATAGVTEQDRVLAQKISDDGRACVVVCNKWDAVVDKDSATYDKSAKYVRGELPQIRWAPILFLSAATGQRVGKIFGAVDDAVVAHRKRVATSVLNEVLREALMWQPPPTRRSGAQAKIYYCHQVSTRPPTVVVFCNDPSLVSDNYRRYLDRKFRESLEGFDATPIRWIYRGRRQRDVMRSRSMNGEPGDGGKGTSFPFPHAD